ncbi:hypothetical protein [Vitiosangium sp. GDMCC 1.1324]|uniref:hypothetical protein n=1 Tax=Vitiosangium sp. (strain GDMCC 1.1324) TaxID=2138576 RepID=UPI001E33DECA|nr:hypothetical protein [Vitiosangium sp. GDMCC 1.1324]
MLSLAISALLGLLPTPVDSDAWAQGRTRSAKANAAAKGKNRKTPSRTESPKQVEPASARVNDPVSGDPAQAASGAPPTRGPARIDFDDRLIQGQTNKSGAVYLYDRKELKTRSMIRERENFRSEIVSTVYDQP